MKSLQAELAHIVDVVYRLSLALPVVDFTLLNDGRQLTQTSGTGDLRQAIAGIYGLTTAKKMVEISNSDLDFEVSGYVSLPELTRANRNYITILINGRYIKNFLLNRAIFDGYGSKLMVGRYPIAVIDIQIDPYLADVNVHPTKQEVRISKEKELMALIKSAIAQSLREQDLIPDALENLAKSSTRGATRSVQTSLPLKQTNLYYDSSRNDFFVTPETVQEDIKPLVSKSESSVSLVANKQQPTVKQAKRSADDSDSEHGKLDYKNNELHLHTNLKNEIGSITSHVNHMLDRISSLNQRDIESQARIYEMELNKKQTQIYAYQSQINPHFLYNMLQCMRGISLMHDIPEVAQICTNMADLFRYSIKGAFLVPLENELNIIDKYLYMIEVRFQGRITYKLEVSENTKDCLIPKMILQPIVENAIFHGLDEIEEGGIVTIKPTRSEDDLYITVTDNGVGFSKEKLYDLTRKLEEEITFINNSSSETSDNIGVINIHNKIRLYEGNNYGLSINNIPNHTSVTLHLNAKQQTTT